MIGWKRIAVPADEKIGKEHLFAFALNITVGLGLR
jgi:hypothetical protein